NLLAPHRFLWGLFISGPIPSGRIPLADPDERLDRRCTLAAGPTGDLSFICGANGGPLTKESFGNNFSEAARMAGVKMSAHGVRKIAATRAANNGATVAQLNALFGWTGSAMASLYTQEADRRRLAIESAHKPANDPATSMPSPDNKVWALGEKDQ
ncbi:MAG: tyrosine-type recombinase/integrase, partial [Xanthobacteraceae bacterium]